MSINKYNDKGYPDPTPYEALTNIEQQKRKQNWNQGFRPLVFICSPYSGDVVHNVRNALRYCRMACERGYLPIAPHLYFTRFLDDMNKDEREVGLFMGQVLLTKCMEVWVFGETTTSGMAQEIRKARLRGMPIRYFTTDGEEV